MSLLVIILVCTSLILLGAAVGKPLGWVAILFAVLALLSSIRFH